MELIVTPSLIVKLVLSPITPTRPPIASLLEPVKVISPIVIVPVPVPVKVKSAPDASPPTSPPAVFSLDVTEATVIVLLLVNWLLPDASPIIPPVLPAPETAPIPYEVLRAELIVPLFTPIIPPVPEDPVTEATVIVPLSKNWLLPSDAIPIIPPVLVVPETSPISY